MALATRIPSSCLPPPLFPSDKPRTSKYPRIPIEFLLNHPIVTSRSVPPVYNPPPQLERGIEKARRRRWSGREDALLERLVAQYGARRWGTLAKYFPGRNGRQVRLRWVNHLQPSVVKGDWTKEEEDLVVRRQKEVGNRWAVIAAELNGRTDNAVKNRFKVILRRAQKQMYY